MSEKKNIMTPREEHELYCHQPDGGWLDEWVKDHWSRVGDVRRCVHGRVMIGIEVPGCTQAYWRDLSPIFTPIRYRRAVKALDED